MSDSVTTALIALLGTIYLTTIPLLVSTRKHAKTSAEQTKNSHPENMRDDLDLVIVAVDSMQRHHGITDTLVRARAEKVRTRNRRSL
jgi:hypothetical protein